MSSWLLLVSRWMQLLWLFHLWGATVLWFFGTGMAGWNSISSNLTANLVLWRRVETAVLTPCPDCMLLAKCFVQNRPTLLNAARWTTTWPLLFEKLVCETCPPHWQTESFATCCCWQRLLQRSGHNAWRTCLMLQVLRNEPTNRHALAAGTCPSSASSIRMFKSKSKRGLHGRNP